MDKADARELAVALHDLAWLLSRTVSLRAADDEALPLSELEIMRLLVRRPGASVGEVAAQLGMHGSNASAAVRALVARGLVERRRDPRDARVTQLFPTARAGRSRDRREAAWGEELLDVVAGLRAGERRRLQAAVPALRALAEQLGRRA